MIFPITNRQINQIAEQQLSPTYIYESYFGVDADGWTAYNGMTVTGNIDTDADGSGDPPSDNWLRGTVSSGGYSLFQFPSLATCFPNYTTNTYEVTMDVYIPSEPNPWVNNQVYLAFLNSFPQYYATPSVCSVGLNTLTFTISNVPSGQVSAIVGNIFGAAGNKIYIKNVKIQDIT